MKTHQRLIQQVSSFLKQKHNIEISLPRLHSLIDSKVNLKIWPTPITIPHSHSERDHRDRDSKEKERERENRYRSIISYIESLLTSSSLDLGTIDAFMQVFLRVINMDIDIIQRNEVIRSNSFKIKEKLHFRIEEIEKRTSNLNSSIQKIHDKSDILSFIAIDIKNYLLSMKLISDQYEQVKSVQVHTPLKIDTIYEYEHSSEQDYSDHYEPLLEVLVRLRSNMHNLHKNVKECDRIDLPLKSVNLLANCKNLLVELEQYLITDHCAFNRLIFHVVTMQSQNIRLISNFYKHYLEFVKGLVYNVFKCVFLGHLFKGYYLQLQRATNSENDSIIELVSKIQPSIKPQAYTEIQKTLITYESSLQKIRQKIKSIQNLICFDRTTIMQLYLQQKICKKLALLFVLKNRVIELQGLLADVKLYIREVRNLEKEGKESVKVREDVEKNMGRLLMQRSSKEMAMAKGFVPDSEADEDKYEKMFRSSFVMIQEKNLAISTVENELTKLQKRCKQPRIKSQYFPKLFQQSSTLKQAYFQLQQKLLQSYQHMLANKSQKQAQALETSTQTIELILTYLSSESKEQGATYSSIGGDITNEDQHCERVKILLSEIDKAEYLIGSTRKKGSKDGQVQRGKQDLAVANKRQLERLRRLLEFLLVLYELSMDQNILESMVDRMDFVEESQPAIMKNVGKVKDLLHELEKHNKEIRRPLKQLKAMKKSLEQEQQQLQSEADQQQWQTALKLVMKIQKIAKQRQNLYEMLQIIYSECLSIYTDLKAGQQGQKPSSFNLQTDGILYFNPKLYSHVLLCYHSLNRTSVINKQLNDCNLQSKTRNFIFDSILEPFNNRLGAFVKFNEEDMLGLTLKLEKSMQLDKEYRGRLRKWEEGVQKGEPTLGEYRAKIRERSKELLEMDETIRELQVFAKKKFMIVNLQDLTKINKECEQHMELARQIIKIETQEGQLTKLAQGKTFKNDKLNQLVKKLHKNVEKKP